MAPLPVPLPLPFPRLLRPTVTRYGDVINRAEAATAQSSAASRAAANGAEGDGAPASVPELTRLAASGQFQEVLHQQRRQLDSAAGEGMLWATQLRTAMRIMVKIVRSC